MGAVNQIAKLRLPNGQEVNFADWNDKPLFSTADLLTGFTDESIELFTYVVGDQVPATSNVTTRRTSTERDTNVSTPGAMASSEEMLVYAIRPEIFELQTAQDTQDDANNATNLTSTQPTPLQNRLAIFHHAAMLSLRVSQKIMHRAGVGYYNFGAGVQTANAGVAVQGLPSQEAVRSLSIPVHIGGQEKYRVTIENPLGLPLNFGDTAATPPVVTDEVYFQVRVHLDGLYKRPVA